MTESNQDISGYNYDTSELNDSHDYLLPAVHPLLGSLNLDKKDKRLFELGCGNGSVANNLSLRGWDVSGVDPSEEGIKHAQASYPDLNLYKGSAYDNLTEQYGKFPVVLSLEVVEHVYAPRDYARTVFELLAPGGTAIISTPYHGYLKNLAMALTGKMDNHFTALWDNGHIKFWSMATLTELLKEAGFVDVRYERVGRVPSLAKSMIAIARKS